jgi:hypothetical protein
VAARWTQHPDQQAREEELGAEPPEEEKRGDVGAFTICDDIRDEGWTHHALPSASNEEAGGEAAPRADATKPSGQQSAAAASVSAAAAMVGKQCLSSMSFSGRRATVGGEDDAADGKRPSERGSRRAGQDGDLSLNHGVRRKSRWIEIG